MGDNAQGSANRWWIIVLVVVVLGAVLALVWWQSRTPGADGVERADADTGRSAASVVGRPAGVTDDAREADSVEDAEDEPGDVSMDPEAQARLPDRVTEPPPGLDELPDRSSTIPPPPSLPETPDWQLDKNLRMAELLADRAERLEQELASAEAAGDEDRAHDRRVLLERTRYRQEDLAGEIEALEAEVEAGGWEDELAAAQAARAEWEAQYGDQEHPYHSPAVHSYSDEEPAPE